MFRSRRGIVNVDTLNVVFKLTTKQPFNRTFSHSALHFRLKVVHQYSVQFLHIVLLERIIRGPTKRTSELLGGASVLACRQTVKETLQCQRYALFHVVFVGGNHMHRTTKCPNMVEPLHKRIQVAGGALVAQSNKPSFRPRVESVRNFVNPNSLHDQFCLQFDRSILEKSLFRIGEFVECNQARKSPIYQICMKSRKLFLPHILVMVELVHYRQPKLAFTFPPFWQFRVIVVSALQVERQMICAFVWLTRVTIWKK
mmetsp:Transcript_20725/g.30820  ORF Transcript_20725/g.30820 Transcript_20725/m.30820 type:complete len:256 (-) Transcript_20725:278-1045(-)